jgi:formamidopyrimidine-DNA glycosylase
MPELAEVELARRQWAAFENQPIIAIESHPKTRIFRDCPAAAFGIFRGKSFLASQCHGKRMLFTSAPDLHLEIHLGMSGKLFTGPDRYEVQKHDHLVFRLPSATLVFSDYRQFGRAVIHDQQDPWQGLPPQPHDRAFSTSYLEKKIRRHHRKPLKAFLLDQTICPGIGNWMADEICWKLRIHPARPVAEIDPAALRKALRFVTLGALRHVADKNSRPSAAGFAPGSYVAEVPPSSWLFQHRWKPGGRCPRCGADLERDTIAGRTTAWCPACQREK